MRRMSWVETLRRVFHEPQIFTLKQWSSYLETTEEEITRWLDGEKLPSAQRLRRITSEVLGGWGCTGAIHNPDLMREFSEILEQPMDQIMPAHLVARTRMIGFSNPCRRLAEYVLQPKLQGALRLLYTFSREVQEELLNEFCKKTTELGKRLPLPPS